MSWNNQSCRATTAESINTVFISLFHKVKGMFLYTYFIFSYYNWFGSPVYTCFLDASKAFDRVEHWSLFKKLIDRNVPLVVVRILVNWYRQQTLCVKWGRNTSSFFTVSNGVRQGGILSPFLFTLYIDELSYQLNNSNLG